MGLRRFLGFGGAATVLSPALEYAWHAWLAHGKRPSKDPSRKMHLDHHLTASEVYDPWLEIRDNVPRLAKVLTGVAAVLSPFVGVAAATGFATGLGAGYVGVTVYHAKMHERGPRGRYEEWMWRFHWHHHAADAKVNFGLTNPVFDFLCGTAVVPDEVVIPARLAPDWLKAAPTCAPGLKVRFPRSGTPAAASGAAS